MTDNIIKFDLKVKEQRRGIKKETQFNSCRHKQMLADKQSQQLECADCGQIVSAWDYILRMCKDEQHLFDHIKYAKVERAQLDAELIDIKRQIRNAKSQLKRAVNKRI